MLVDLRMALLAGLRTQVVRRAAGLKGLSAGNRTSKVSDVRHELPALRGGLPMRTAHCRHTRELNAILDDVVNLAIAEILGGI